MSGNDSESANSNDIKVPGDDVNEFFFMDKGEE
jgi:hypothetical protein